jgi:hypothetical protein
MAKKVLFWVFVSTGLALFIAECTKINYDNPIDIEGSKRQWLIDNPGALADSNGNKIADYFENDKWRPKDTLKPVIKLIGSDTVKIPIGDPNNLIANYLDQITVTDAGGGPTTILEPISNVNVFQVNTVPYTIIYSAQDSSGNRATATRYVFIVPADAVDKKAPIISIGDTVKYVSLGETYTDQGVAAYDEIDGTISSDKIIRTGTVNTAVEGTYTLTYKVSDKAGNTATATRKVIVQKGSVIIPDLEQPVLTLLGKDTIKIPDDMKIGDFMKTYKDAGCTAMDKHDGDITSKIMASPIAPLAGKFWFITYSVTDSAGNTAAPVKRIFETKDIQIVTPPILDLKYPDSTIQLILPASGPAKWVEPGFDASDVVDGDLKKSVIVDSSTLVANLSKTGIYTVIYSVTNSGGASTQKVRTVQISDNKIDIVPPVITLKGRNPDTVLVKSAAAYTDPGATALDNKDGDVTAKISKSGTVKMTAIGKNTINYSVTDLATNVGRASRIVWVVMDTLTTDLMVRYMVPSENPLPNLDNKKYISYDIDGEGPDLSSVTKLDFSWSLVNKSLYNFQFTFNKEPYNKSFNSVSNNFGSVSPAMTLNATGVPGLDGKYYVTVVNGDFVWVATSGKFAILWHD